jgi:5-methylcytosine-specific restriction endonuclease McrA
MKTLTFIGNPCPKGHTERSQVNGNCIQCRRDLKRAQFAANPAAQERRSKAWRDRNKSREATRFQRWVQNNPERLRAKYANEEAARKRAPGKWTGEDIAIRKKLQKGRCAYFRHCGNRLGDDFHCDHIEPLKHGGTNHPSNLQLTCPTCNLTKGAKPPTVFARQIGYLI